MLKYIKSSKALIIPLTFCIVILTYFSYNIYVDIGEKNDTMQYLGI